MLTNWEKRYKTACLINYVFFAALLVQLLYWNLMRESGFTLTILLVQTLPLLAFLPGMLKENYRSYSWLCFTLLFYFIFAVERVFSSISGPLDALFLAWIVVLFVSAMMTSRYLQRWKKGGVPSSGEKGSDDVGESANSSAANSDASLNN